LIKKMAPGRFNDPTASAFLREDERTIVESVRADIASLPP
jgi:hypothetical protein